MDSLYFSFTTLTTLGYGDLTPAGDVGRMLAITEALIGQVYLVTIVALIVTNLGREQESPAARLGLRRRLGCRDVARPTSSIWGI